MKDRIREITREMWSAGGATKESLDELTVLFGVTLSPDYLEFMTSMNGAEGRIGKNSYLAIWQVEEIAELNNGVTYIRDEHPEWLFFGGMGGGSWYAFDTRYQPMPVVEVDLSDPDYNYVRGASFEEFLENLYKAEE